MKRNLNLRVSDYVSGLIASGRCNFIDCKDRTGGFEQAAAVLNEHVNCTDSAGLNSITNIELVRVTNRLALK